MQTGIEKNLFGNHPVSLLETDSRGPPPAFTSGPLVVPGNGGGEYGSMSASGAKDFEAFSTSTGSSYTKPSSIDIVEVDGPSAANTSLSNNEPNYLRSSSPAVVSTYLLLY